MKKLAPVVIFVYNRLQYLKKTINNLKKNELAKDTRIFIFSDAGINYFDKIHVSKVRNYLKNIDGFKKIKIYHRKKNFGLAKNIISGVTQVFKKENKLIVIEDDILTSKNFLRYMNESLKKYENKKKVWHISGWSYNINLKIENSAYFTRVMNCWGWATWKNRWKNFRKDPEKFLRKWDEKKIKSFNIDNSYNFFSQIIRNKKKIINTWGIFWYASIFDKNKLCLNPKNSLTQNIGFGENSTNTYTISKIFESRLKKSKFDKTKLPNKLKENTIVFDTIKKEFEKNKKKSFLRKIKFLFK